MIRAFELQRLQDFKESLYQSDNKEYQYYEE